MTYATSTQQTFVLFPLGTKRFALPAEQVSELAPHERLDGEEQQTFPHTTPLITGVVVRRNQIMAVADIAPVLMGAHLSARKFYLIVTVGSEADASRTAIPVTGECELAEAERLPLTGTLPPYVSGLLSLKDEIVEVLDLEKLMLTELRI